MKVFIGKYTNWVGPYQLAETLKYIGIPEKTYRKVGEKLSHTWIFNFCNFIHSYKKRNIKVKIDNYDVWSADHTLALVILPTLKLLKEKKHGSPYIKDEDVPDTLKSTNDVTSREEWVTDNYFHARWDWVLGEMIWAFSMIVDEDDGYGNNIESYKEHNERIDNGTRLFGKYYRALWD